MDWDTIVERMQDSRVRQASDFVTQLGGGSRPFLWLNYGCPHCRMWTVGPHHRYRVQPRVKELTDDSTTEGATTGGLRCALCFKPWTWALGGGMRLITVGSASEHSGFENGYHFALIGGGHGDSVDVKIKFLQTATLLTELNGRPVSEEALEGALFAIQETVENKFANGMAEVSVAYPKLVSQRELDQANVDIFCQSGTLSLPGPGRRMLVIKQDAIENRGQKVETIDPEELDRLLDLAATAYVSGGAYVYGSDAADGAYVRDPEVESFDGSSFEPFMISHCDFCNRDFEHPSVVAYLYDDDPGHPFAKPDIFAPRPVRNACAWCASKFHSEKYVERVEGKIITKVTRMWTRGSQPRHRGPRKPRSTRLNNHHTALLLKLHDQKHEPAA